MEYRVNLDNFAGPLDLLLFFIRRDELDIMDIPIAQITQEYLSYVDALHSLNVSVSGEFIVMAASLMRIKAKMLLPQLMLDDGEEFEDPRTELMRRLLEYQQFKEAAENLTMLVNEHNLVYPRTVVSELENIEEEPSVYLEDISIFELVKTFKTLLERIPDDLLYEVSREEVHIKEQIAFILAKFIDKSHIQFSELIPHLNTRQKIITTFLAILELIKNRQIRVKQKSVFDDFILERIEA